MNRLTHWITLALLGLCALGSVAFAAERAASVVFVMGQAQVERQGKVSALKAGDGIFESDRVVTSKTGHLHLKTRDGSLIAIRPDSSLVLEAYRLEPNLKDQTAIRWELSKGVVRFVTGDDLEKRKDRFRLNTPIAAIGVRGTDFSVFADNQITRVSVVLGEVVLAPLVGSCQREAVGICSGENALGLSAGERQSMLILERGQLRPRLAPIDATAPDRVSPPLEGKAVSSASPAESKAGTAPVEPKPNAQAVAEPQAQVTERVAQVIEATTKQAIVAPPPVATEPPAAVSPPVETPVAPEPIKVHWARWKPVGSSGQQASVLEKKEDGSYLFANDTHMIYRLPEHQPKLPTSGSVVFNLGDAEAFFLNGGVAFPATVEKGSLSVDFARSTFLFDMSINADSKLWDLKAAGDLTLRGLLVSDWKTPGANTTVRGALAGTEVTQAATVFNRTVSATQQISGAARWSR